MKKLITTFILSFICVSMFAQVHVSSSGNVGIATSYPDAKLQIVKSGNDITFKPSNSGVPEIGANDGSSNSVILFWHSIAGYNVLRAKNFTKTSDSTFKREIVPIQNAMEVLEQINGYSYFYSENPDENGSREYGVIAQEIAPILPEIVDTVHEILAVDYDQLIPFLIEAVKKQQTEIESLQEVIEVLVSERGTRGISIQNLDMGQNMGSETRNLMVYQNAPNPFGTNTTIRCYIPENIIQAELSVYDIQGNRVKRFEVTERGDVELQLVASSLPAGIYAYVLTGDGQSSETKQMVLTK